MQFYHLTREYDNRFFTGLTTTGTFETLCDLVFSKSSVMSYWEGPKRTSLLQNNQINDRLDSVEETPVLPEHETFPLKRGPSRKLSNEQELLMTLMKLRLGLLTDDLAFRFQVSSTRVSQIFITWIRILSRELSCLIIWPSRGQIHKTLPHYYKRFYPKVRTIIDCIEVFVETPSSLEVQSFLWSEYKKRCIFTFLIAITKRCDDVPLSL